MSTAKSKGTPARGTPPAQRKPKRQPSTVAVSNNINSNSTPPEKEVSDNTNTISDKQTTCPVCSSLGPASDCVPCLVCNGTLYFFLTQVPAHRRCSQLQKSSYVCKLCCRKQPKKTATKRYLNVVDSLVYDSPIRLMRPLANLLSASSFHQTHLKRLRSQPVL
jgi:hypothetical protein